MRFVVVLSLLILVSCGPSIRIVLDYRAEGFAISDIKGTHARLYVNPNVDILEFKLAFVREYRTKDAFVSRFSNDLERVLNLHAVISKGDSGEAKLLFVERSLSESSVSAQRSVFDSAREDYFIGITKVTISNHTTGTPQFYRPPTPGNPGGFSGGGVSEACVVSLKAEVWSVKEKRKLSEFTAVGSSTVFLFMHGTALTNAVEDAIISVGRYVKDNRLR